ncbi:MAG: hypothetical protein KUG76_08305 [Gammaproteobacteria bacterium]|nr:hypothetical protein [Gammaproteobacteria bacterium]
MKAYGIKEEKRSRTSLRLPPSMLNKINTLMSEKGYSVKDRSRWICHSLQELTMVDCYCELIAEAFMDPGENEHIPLTMDQNTVTLLAQISDEFTRQYQSKIIDQSGILRTAIMYRIIKESSGLVT